MRKIPPVLTAAEDVGLEAAGVVDARADDGGAEDGAVDIAGTVVAAGVVATGLAAVVVTGGVVVTAGEVAVLVLQAGNNTINTRTEAMRINHFFIFNSRCKYITQVNRLNPYLFQMFILGPLYEMIMRNIKPEYHGR